MAEGNITSPMKCGSFHDDYILQAQSLGMPDGICIVCKSRSREQEQIQHAGQVNLVSYPMRHNQQEFLYILARTPDENLSVELRILKEIQDQELARIYMSIMGQTEQGRVICHPSADTLPLRNTQMNENLQMTEETRSIDLHNPDAN